MCSETKNDLPKTWQWPGIWAVNLPILVVFWHQLFARSFEMWFTGYHFFATAGLAWSFAAGERWIYFFREKPDSVRFLSGDVSEQRGRMIRILLLIIIGLYLIAIVGARTRETAGMLIWTTLGGLYLIALRLAPEKTDELLPREMALALYLSGISLLFVWANAGFDPMRFILPGMLLGLLLFHYLCLTGSWSPRLVPLFSKTQSFEETGPGFLKIIPYFLVAVSLLLLVFNRDRTLNVVFLSIGISALNLLLLDLFGKSIPKPAKRICADITMLTPILPILIL